MRVIHGALCMLALGPSCAIYADFSWELAGTFDHTQRERDPRRYPTGEVDSDLVSFSATHYFNSVEERSGPLALGAFLDPSTNLSVVAGEEQATNRFFSGPNSLRTTQTEEDVSDYSLRGLYLFPKSKWYAGGRYARNDGESHSSSQSLIGTSTGARSSDVQSYAVFAGKYFGMGATRLELSLEQSTTENESSSTECSWSGICFTPAENSSEETWDTPRLAVMHVRRFRSATYALLGDISEERFRDGMFNGVQFSDSDLDPPRTYFVGAELYPVPTVGVRLGYESLDSRGFDEDTVSIGASWFFRRNVGLELTLSREDEDEGPFFSADDSDSPNTNRAVLRVIGRL